MRTNIIQTLIIAFVLIAGWSLFTIYQDLQKSGKGIYSSDVLLNKGREYLPVSNSSGNYGERTLPKYKYPSRKGGSQGAGAQRSRSVTGGSFFGSSTFGISNPTGTSGGGYIEMSVTNSSGKGSGNNNSSQGYSAVSFAPFSKKFKIQTQRDLAMNEKQSETSAGLFSDGTRYKAFGDPGEGDLLEEGGGDENEEFYNDMPVGDGVWILIILSLIYLCFKIPYSRILKKI